MWLSPRVGAIFLCAPGPAQKAPWMSRDGARALGIPSRAAGLAGAQLSWSPALGQGGRSFISRARRQNPEGGRPGLGPLA